MRVFPRTKRMFRVGIAVAVVALSAGCGSGESSPTTLVAPTTTLDDASPVPGSADCSDERLSADLGVLGYATCEGEWAAVQPATYTDACIDCETIWLARWSGAAWTLRARCHALVVLTPSEHGCTAVTGTFATETDAGTLREFPSSETACAIWGFNTVEESLEATGCTEQ